MRSILKIFSNDVRSIVKHFFALAIAVAICILPALYAWVNIYANSNPYVNTGNINIAVASRDPGIDLDDGTHVNSADDIADSLKDSTTIGWQFPENADAAIEGVRSGKYYAAIIFEDKFTYDMYHFEETLSGEEVPLTYYENAKKNAVATKITETAAQTLLENINTRYLEILLGQFFDDANELSEELSNDDVADEAVKKLEELRDTLNAYDSALGAFTSNSAQVKKALKNTEVSLNNKRSNGKKAITKAEKNLNAAKSTINALSDKIDSKLSSLKKIVNALDDTVKNIQTVEDEETKQQLIEDAKEKTERVLTHLETLRRLIPDDGNITGSRSVADTLDIMIQRGEDLLKRLEEDPAGLDTIADDLTAIRELLNNNLESQFKSMIEGLDVTISGIRPFIGVISGMLDDVEPVLDSAGNTVTSLDTAMLQLRKVLRSSADKLDELIGVIEGAEGDERLDLLLDLLGGDSDLYSKFFSSLVDVRVEEVYSVASYGAAMAPFYSVLAIWVGGVILVSILKTHVNRKKFPEAGESQCFFGRFIIFFIIGQLQAAVIVAGDIFLLGCAPVHPWLMWLAGSVTSLVFVMFIYSLTLAFGDVGKAIVVVIMVVQIAGSSGSYPIEILPEIFDKIYRFFPFPYAINAMREALCGIYGTDYWRYLAEMMVFLVLGIAIGLFIRKPFIGMNRFVSEKLEETEVL